MFPCVWRLIRCSLIDYLVLFEIGATSAHIVIILPIFNATDGNRAAIAVAEIGCFADAIVGTRALRGSHLSHASSNLDITAGTAITGTDTSTSISISTSSRYDSTRDGDVAAGTITATDTGTICATSR